MAMRNMVRWAGLLLLLLLVFPAVAGAEKTHDISTDGRLAIDTSNLTDDEYYITCLNGPTSNIIDVTGNGEVNITLEDVNISVTSNAFTIDGGATVNLTLEGANSLKSGATFAGLYVAQGSTLHITSESMGSLEATGGTSTAGIGGLGSGGTSHGTIKISGGTITAYGGAGAAGIGSGVGGSGGIIEIAGGEVTAYGGDGVRISYSGGAGIGGGASGNAGRITIGPDATVKAIGGKGATVNGLTDGDGAAVGGGGKPNYGRGETADQLRGAPIAKSIQLKVRLNGEAWEDHSKQFTLVSASGQAATVLKDSVLFLNVTDGSHALFIDGENSGMTIDAGPGAFRYIDYYTVEFSASKDGTATGASIEAKYNDKVISNDDVLLGGGKLELTASGTGADDYSYIWQDDSTEQTLTIQSLEAKAEVSCKVSGKDLYDPVPGGGGKLAAEDLLPASLTLQWKKGTDTATEAKDLLYYVYQADEDISTLALCDNKGTLLNAGGTANIDSYGVSGLAPSQTYYFNVVVVDKSGKKAAYGGVSAQTPAEPAKPGPPAAQTPAPTETPAPTTAPGVEATYPEAVNSSVSGKAVKGLLYVFLSEKDARGLVARIPKGRPEGRIARLTVQGSMKDLRGVKLRVSPAAMKVLRNAQMDALELRSGLVDIYLDAKELEAAYKASAKNGQTWQLLAMADEDGVTVQADLYGGGQLARGNGALTIRLASGEAQALSGCPSYYDSRAQRLVFSPNKFGKLSFRKIEPGAHWAGEYLRYAQASKLLGAGLSPDAIYRGADGKTLTRLQFAQRLYKDAIANERPLRATLDAYAFRDDTADEAVVALQQAGVVTPLSDGTFGGGQKITNAQAAAMLARLDWLALDPLSAYGWTLSDDGKAMYYSFTGGLTRGNAEIGGAKYSFDKNGFLAE